MSIESINRVSVDKNYTGNSTIQVDHLNLNKTGETKQPDKADELTAETDLSKTVAVKDKNELPNQEKKEESASLKDVRDINKIINRNTIAEFGYNEPTKRITIKIKDKETNEVIKEIPSEKALQMLEKAWELAGILVDEKR